MSRVICGAFIALTVSLIAAPLWAHHSPSAIFDMSKRMPLTAVTVEINRAKDPTNLYGYLYKITFQDGTSLELTNSGEYPR